MTGNLRMILRLVFALAWTLVAAPLQTVFLGLPGRVKERFALVYWRGIRVILGLRLTVQGELSLGRPVVFIANHCSWLDIVALGSLLPGCFVAKSAIARWPVFNVIAWLGRTVFVSRGKAGVGREREALNVRLAAGDNIILFPEGTTSDGTRLLRFQSAFLSIAGAASQPVIQPVTIVYDGVEGLPVRRRDRPSLSWYGDMNLVSHFPGVGRRGQIHATVILDPAIPPGRFAGRKMLTEALEARLTANAAALRQGREVLPALLTDFHPDAGADKADGDE